MKPCYVFGPWIDRAPNPGNPSAIAAVREAPNPSERAEIWRYTVEPNGESVSGDVAGWYGCFGTMDNAVRLAGPDVGMEDAKRLLDARIGVAGHMLAECIEAIRQRADAVSPATVPSLDALARELFRASLDGPEVQTRHYDTEPTQDRLRWLDVALMVRSKYIDRPTTPATPAPAPATSTTDTPVGDDRAPDRCMASGRETIDEVRDVCRHLAGYGNEKLADALFAVHCLLTAYVYRSRAGKKGPAKEDHAKAGWYMQMVRHVIGSLVDRMESGSRKRMIETSGRNYDDPRASRPTYQPYDGATATLPPVGLGKIFKTLVPLEIDILASAFGSGGYLYQTPEKGKGKHGFSRVEMTIGGRGSTTFAPTHDEIEAVLPKEVDARAMVGGFSVRRCSCGGVIVGGFSCPACGCGP